MSDRVTGINLSVSFIFANLLWPRWVRSLMNGSQYTFSEPRLSLSSPKFNTHFILVGTAFISVCYFVSAVTLMPIRESSIPEPMAMLTELMVPASSVVTENTSSSSFFR